MAHDVFLCHSARDNAVAEAIVTRLEAESVTCWIAPRDIVPGADWGESILNAIESSRIMILIFSENANASPQIKREVERAVNKGVYIIPFRVDNIKPTRSLEYFISAAQWLDAFPPPLERHLDNLVKAVKTVLKSPPLPSAKLPFQPESPGIPQPLAHPRAWRKPSFIAAAIAGLIIVGYAGRYFARLLPSRVVPTTTATPIVTVAATPTPIVTVAAATPTPVVALAATATPVVTLAATARPVVALAATPTAVVTLAATAMPVVALAPTARPVVALAATPRPVVTLAATPTPAVALAATARPVLTVAATARPVVALAATPRPVVTVAATATPVATTTSGIVQEVRRFVIDYYRKMQEGRLDDVLSDYNEWVDYRDYGRRDKEFIREDMKPYFRRWPLREYQCDYNNDIHIRSVDSDTVTAKFNFRYIVRDPASGRRASGSAVDEWVISKKSGALRIVSQKETVKRD